MAVGALHERRLGRALQPGITLGDTLRFGVVFAGVLTLSS